jgi:hypothetical protein
MKQKTKAEAVFEEFCRSNDIPLEKIRESSDSTPDYAVMLYGKPVIVEVKQIDEDEKFNLQSGVSSRTVGSHVRKKVTQARKQKQFQKASAEGVPTILLVYNALDPSQRFGTEPHDFIAALYGEMTVVLNPKDLGLRHSFYGRNASFREDQNTSISAVGHLWNGAGCSRVHLFENCWAKNKIEFSRLPPCMEITRVVPG